MNYYELLEVNPNASAAVIRAAYKSLMQVYHPDKNPDDVAIAQRASLVVQAYEVLSDSDRRLAYDRELRRKSKDARNRVPASAATNARAGGAAKRTELNVKHVLLLCALIVLMVVSGRSIMAPFKAPPPPMAAPVPTAAPAAYTGGGGRNSETTTIPALITALSVNLVDRSKPAEGAEHVLFIPILDVKVGPRDPDSAIRHLKNTADQIRQQLQEDLAAARFEELIKPDGEQYLTMMILDTLCAVSGLSKPACAATSPDRYGAVEVLLPESFSVR